MNYEAKLYLTPLLQERGSVPLSLFIFNATGEVYPSGSERKQIMDDLNELQATGCIRMSSTYNQKRRRIEYSVTLTNQGRKQCKSFK